MFNSISHLFAASTPGGIKLNAQREIPYPCVLFPMYMYEPKETDFFWWNSCQTAQ